MRKKETTKVVHNFIHVSTEAATAPLALNFNSQTALFIAGCETGRAKQAQPVSATVQQNN